ncbi:macrolide transporter subunit MacA [compost metagenome]
MNDYVSRQDDVLTPLESTEEARLKGLADKEIARLSGEVNKVNASIQEKELQQKKQKLAEANYKADAAGIFLYDNPGKRPQAVGENEYIGKIVDLTKLQFVTLVGEQDVFRIKQGMSVDVKINAMKELKLKGTVQSVSKFAKTGTDQNNLGQAAQFEVIISLEPNEHLIAGLSLTGAIEIERKEKVIVIPTMAIINEEDKHYVMFDAGNGQYERRAVTIGLETPEHTEVLEGVKEGDKVALP